MDAGDVGTQQPRDMVGPYAAGDEQAAGDRRVPGQLEQVLVAALSVN